jgi:hypothetical protein
VVFTRAPKSRPGLNATHSEQTSVNKSKLNKFKNLRGIVFLGKKKKPGMSYMYREVIFTRKAGGVTNQ